jgi:PrgI family protein
MASYKVIQDIEAEDKLIGPLTFRQFVYAGAAALCGYLSFLVITKHAGFLAVIFLPVGAASAFFAWPFAGDQPTEVWALAKIRFFVKPRRRIWNQSGVKELVTITAPKKIERAYTNGLSPNEVQSRLRVLADTIDSRGWAIKNVNVNMYGRHSLIMDDSDSDRLINLNSMPQAVPSIDIRASDDMLDEQNNPIAQQFDNMIAASTKAHRQQIIDRLRQSAALTQAQQQEAARASAAARQNPAGARSAAIPGKAPAQPKPPASNYWFMNPPMQPGLSSPQDAVTFNAQVVAPSTSATSLPTQPANPTADEEALLLQLASQQSDDTSAYSHLHTIQPLSAQQQAMSGRNPAAQTASQQVTQRADAAILDLARNDDLNVATIAREAHKRTEPPDEVVISLH